MKNLHDHVYKLIIGESSCPCCQPDALVQHAKVFPVQISPWHIHVGPLSSYVLLEDHSSDLKDAMLAKSMPRCKQNKGVMVTSDHQTVSPHVPDVPVHRSATPQEQILQKDPQPDQSRWSRIGNQRRPVTTDSDSFNFVFCFSAMVTF